MTTPVDRSQDALKTHLKEVEGLVSDDAQEKRLLAMAALAEQLGGKEAALGIVDTHKRIRTQLRVACLGLNKALTADDEAGIEMCQQQILEVMAQEVALGTELARAVSTSLFLLSEQLAPRLYTWHLEGPAHLQSMVKMLKSEMKAETGRAVQDWEALVAAVHFCLTYVDDFKKSPLVVGPSHAYSATASRQGMTGGR